MGVLVLPVFTSDAQEVPDMDEFVTSYNGDVNGNGNGENGSSFSYVTKKTYPEYADRIMGVCQDLYELGYL